MLFVSLLVVICFLAAVSAKMVEVRQKVLTMNDKDRIVGSVEHVFFRDDQLKSTPPPMPGKYLNSSVKTAPSLMYICLFLPIQCLQ